MQQNRVHTNWKQWSNTDEDQRLEVIERRISFKEESLRELSEKRRKMYEQRLSARSLVRFRLGLMSAMGHPCQASLRTTG